MTTMRELQALLDEILEIAEENPGTQAIEPHLRQLRQFMHDHVLNRVEISASLQALLQPAPGGDALGRPGAVEILEYTMHDFRWAEVRHALLELDAPTSNWNESHAAQRALSAYEDDWPDADIYDTYRTD